MAPKHSLYPGELPAFRFQTAPKRKQTRLNVLFALDLGLCYVLNDDDNARNKTCIIF